MAEPTIQDVFGVNAVQNLQNGSLTIFFSDMVDVIPGAEEVSNPEAMLFLIVEYASRSLNEGNRASDRANRNVTVVSSEFDVLEDPVGSGQMWRRDIRTMIGYSPVANTPTPLGSF